MTSLDENATAEEPSEAPGPPDPELTPQLGPRWALAPRHLAVLGVFCLLLLILNYLPLRGTDIWGHVAYGNWIMDHRQLPTEDPFAPLAAGMRVIDSAWLSQLTFAAVERWGGAEALSTVFACVSAAALLLIFRACFLQSRRLAIGVAGLLITLIVGFSRTTTIRPEIFGALGFALLLWLLVRHQLLSRHWPSELADQQDKKPAAWSLWVGTFLTMLLWANLHGSFVCGLALLTCLFVGRAIEAAWQGRSWQALWSDRETRRRLVLLEVATLATLINPYGLDLLLMSLGFSGNDVLADVLEWQPLRLDGVGGREFAGSWILLTLVLRQSRHRVPVAEGLMLGLFALAAALRLRMIGWYAMVLAVFLAPHLAELWNRFAKPVESEPQLAPRDNSLGLSSGRSWTYSLVALLIVWITFALAPLGRPVVGDEPRPPGLLYDNDTPLTASAYLRENPPAGQIFNPQWWGDWLVWDGPEGLQPFVTTNMHLIPQQVWEDYRRISTRGTGWERALRRYRIDTLVLDRKRQERLETLCKRSADWKVAFEDEQALIMTRTAKSKGGKQPDADGKQPDDAPKDKPADKTPDDSDPSPPGETPQTSPQEPS